MGAILSMWHLKLFSCQKRSHIKVVIVTVAFHADIPATNLSVVIRALTERYSCYSYETQLQKDERKSTRRSQLDASRELRGRSRIE